MYRPSVIKYWPSGVIKQDAAEPVKPEIYLTFVKLVINIPSRPLSSKTILRSF
jgi:hypothetical protein